MKYCWSYQLKPARWNILFQSITWAGAPVWFSKNLLDMNTTKYLPPVRGSHTSYLPSGLEILTSTPRWWGNKQESLSYEHEDSTFPCGIWKCCIEVRTMLPQNISENSRWFPGPWLQPVQVLPARRFRNLELRSWAPELQDKTRKHAWLWNLAVFMDAPD